MNKKNYMDGNKVRLSQSERDVLYHLSTAWNKFCSLPKEHPHDNEEFRGAIHKAQLLILARPERKTLAIEQDNQDILSLLNDKGNNKQ